MNYFWTRLRQSLLLIDGLVQAPTDLGASMAQVFLMELNKSKTVMTTHYNSIKLEKSELPRVNNGSMRFNSSDLTPEYVLNQGTPGSSYTYEVAQKVGVPQNIIDRAGVGWGTVAITACSWVYKKKKMSYLNNAKSFPSA